MKIFDCFLYHDEDLILDIRLNELDEMVEKFVVVESRFDHQGNKKELNFQINNFKKFEHKIIYLAIENFPDTISNWKRENFQRNYLINGLSTATDDDYVMISDVDEIPNFSAANNLNKFKYSVFEQKMYNYKINLINKTSPFWYGSRICKKKYLKSPQWLRNQKVIYPFWKFYKVNWNIIENGGWHFSFLMSPEKIRKKINSYAHSEYNNEKYKNLTKIKHSIENNIDLFDRPFKYEKVNIDQSFPNYIIKNKVQFKNWIL